MRILFLSQRVPYPPNRGDKITTWRLLERMRRTHEVRVIAFAHDDADRDAARHLNSIGLPTFAFDHDARKANLRALPLLFTDRPLTLGVFGSRDLQCAVDREASCAELAYAYSSSMGAFLEPHTQLARVMHFAELDSDKWQQYAERSSAPMKWIYQREQRTLLAFETRVAHAFSENVFCTPLEQKIFQERVPGASSFVLRNGVDLAYYAPRPELAEARHLVFTGVMDYLPNVDGCEFFVREVLPLLRPRYPGLRFTIVGSNPTAAIRALCRQPGVEVTGFVDDTRAWLARASISVAPLRIARGIQNKVLEALAMGLPVVGTSSATQGIEGVDGRDFIVANSAQEQSAAIAKLFDAPLEAQALGRRGREFVEDQYDWERVMEPLDRLLERLSPRNSPSNALARPMSHEQLARTFDQWAAEGRDAGMEEEHSGVFSQVVTQLGIRPGEQILDLGCGNGWATRRLAKAAAGATAIGVDVSSKMIARAEEMHSLTIRARYEVAAIENLGFKDAKFDRVFSMEALYYAVDLDRALAEALRVLKPAGRADVIVDFYAESPSTKSWPAKTGLAMHYLSTTQWCEAFERAGFIEVCAQRVVDERTPESIDPLHAASKADGSLWISARKPA